MLKYSCVQMLQSYGQEITLIYSMCGVHNEIVLFKSPINCKRFKKGILCWSLIQTR